MSEDNKDFEKIIKMALYKLFWTVFFLNFNL